MSTTPQRGHDLGGSNGAESAGRSSSVAQVNLGDGVAGAAHEDGLAGTDIAADEVVEVVQGGRVDGDPADLAEVSPAAAFWVLDEIADIAVHETLEGA